MKFQTRQVSMKTRLSSILLFFICAMSAQARSYPNYSMYAMVQLSDIIVYCEEKDIQDAKGGTVINCKVLQTFKGDAIPSSDLAAYYSSLFKRSLYHSGPKDFPPGKALLFLRKDNSGSYRVLDAKLLQNGEVFRFAQIADSFAPLSLTPQQPENITLAKDQKYGEKELLEDLAAALKKSR
jgi:hypothetical protein